MTARVYKFTTANTTNLRRVSENPAVVKGGSFVNTTAAAYYVKLYWFKPTASAAAPTVGTTIPDFTIGVPGLDPDTGFPGTLTPSWPDGLIKDGGQLFVAVTTGAGDDNTGAVATNQGVISLLVE